MRSGAPRSASCRCPRRPRRRAGRRRARRPPPERGSGRRGLRASAPRIRRSVPLPDSTDWLGFCRRAAGAARDAVHAYATTAERAVETGRGVGGDTAYVIDRAAEDAVFREIEALGVPLTAISEERGEIEVAGGGAVRIVIDPVDGSLNAKRGLPFACVSI